MILPETRESSPLPKDRLLFRIESFLGGNLKYLEDFVKVGYNVIRKMRQKKVKERIIKKLEQEVGEKERKLKETKQITGKNIKKKQIEVSQIQLVDPSCLNQVFITRSTSYQSQGFRAQSPDHHYQSQHPLDPRYQNQQPLDSRYQSQGFTAQFLDRRFNMLETSEKLIGPHLLARIRSVL